MVAVVPDRLDPGGELFDRREDTGLGDQRVGPSGRDAVVQPGRDAPRGLVPTSRRVTTGMPPGAPSTPEAHHARPVEADLLAPQVAGRAPRRR
jgi:hypothetical protein